MGMLKLMGFWRRLLPSLGCRASPACEGSLLEKDLYNLSRICTSGHRLTCWVSYRGHENLLLRGNLRAHKHKTTNSFHLGCHALKKICGNSTCTSCFSVSIKHSGRKQLVKKEVVVLPSLPFATCLCQHFNSPVKLQESLIPIFWPF